jgi:hypothetical protein
MKAFVVHLNGQPFVTAGVGHDGVLTTNIVWVGGAPPRPAEGRLHLQVGGLDSRTGEHLRWSVPEIRVGDEITIKIIETDQVTPEDSRARPDEALLRRTRQEVEERMRQQSSRPDAGQESPDVEPADGV